MDCGLEVSSCDWIIEELGPPPDMIIRLPPPPLPSFVDEEFLGQVRAAVQPSAPAASLNHSLCHWCAWARSNEIAVVEFPETEAALQDTWFFVILASCLMLTLGAVLAGFIYLKIHGRNLKTAWDATLGPESLSNVNSSTLGSSKSCEPVRFSSSAVDNVSSNSLAASSSRTAVAVAASTRALWAGVKTTQGNHYTITHAQPLEQQRRQVNDYAESTGYTTLSPSATTENKIYYCSTDIMVGLPTEPAPVATRVTSLDDEEQGICKQHHVYVNTPVYGAKMKQRYNFDVSAPIVCSNSNFPPLNSRAPSLRI